MSQDHLPAVGSALAAIEEAWHRADVEGVLRGYASDIILTGEGVPVVLRGKEQVSAVIPQLIGANPKTCFKIVSGRSFGDGAETWISASETVDGTTTLDLRVLCAWTQEGGQWVIASESFSVGALTEA